MSGTMSKARQMAEVAFDKAQSQFLDRTRALREQDAEISERADKTQRLRMARLEREKAGKIFDSLTVKNNTPTKSDSFYQIEP